MNCDVGAIEVTNIQNENEFEKLCKNILKSSCSFFNVIPFKNEEYFDKLIIFLKESKKNTLVRIIDNFKPDWASNNIAFLVSYDTFKDRISEIENTGNLFILRVVPNNLLEVTEFLQYIKNHPKYPAVINLKNINDDIAYIFNLIRKMPRYIQENLIIRGASPCFIRDEDIFEYSYYQLFDIKEIIKIEGIQSLSIKDRISRFKKYNACKECARNKDCFGIYKDCDQPISPRTSKLLKPYLNTTSFLDKCHLNLDLGIHEFNSRKLGEDPETILVTKDVETLQNCRLHRSLSGPNFYHVVPFAESMYFNRPLTEEPLFQEDPRGLISLNWQFIGKGIPELAWKQKCDMILPHHGFSILSKIKFNNFWTMDTQNTLDTFTLNTLKEIIIEHGGDPEKISQKGNDLLYNGKKFAGEEWMYIPTVGYIENTIVTCEYKPEEKYFKQIYHWAGEKTITGITEEVPAATKEVLMEGLIEKFKKTFNKNF